MLAGCGTPTKDKKESGKTTIATTIFPEYDWVKEIIKGAEGIEVKLLMKNGTDLHNYQPSADDVIEIINSDLFIYVGGESDEWVNDVLDESKNKAINLLDVLGEKAKEEEVIEGMQAEEEDEEESEYDEHVWLSINNAVIFVNEICKRLTDIDQSNAEIYRNNVESYIQKAGFKRDVDYFKEMYIHEIEQKWNVDLSAISNQGKMEKRFDFVIKTYL